MNLSSMGLLSRRDLVSVSLLVSSSEMEATLNRTMVAAATSATETRYRNIPSANLGLPIRPTSPGSLPRRALLSGFSEVNGDKFHPRWVRPAAEAMVARLRGAGTRCFVFFKAHLCHWCLSHSIPAPLTLVRAAPRSRALSIRISLNICSDTATSAQLERHRTGRG